MLALALALTITGAAAYIGMLKIAKPQAGETVVVSGAAGATGSIAAQIAKIKGARVIGVAGGPAKCKWLTETLGLDHAIDYKSENLPTRLAELCPNGIDVFFDNVGGLVLEAVLPNLTIGARVALSGAISTYGDIEGQQGVRGLAYLTAWRATMTGFIATDLGDELMEALTLLLTWIGEGKLHQEIDVQEGFENVPTTFTRIFKGKNLGKQLLKL